MAAGGLIKAKEEAVIIDGMTLMLSAMKEEARYSIGMHVLLKSPAIIPWWKPVAGEWSRRTEWPAWYPL